MSTQSVVADRVIYNQTLRSLSTVPSTAAAACQVQMELDGDGNIISKGCKSVNCDGKCTLQEKDKGEGVTEYWCTCD